MDRFDNLSISNSLQQKISFLNGVFSSRSQYFQSLGIRKISIFGSAACGWYQDASDIDIALFVNCGDNLAYLNVQLDLVVATFKQFLEELGFKVEVEGIPSSGDIHLRGVLIDYFGNPIDFIDYEKIVILWDSGL